VNPLTSNTPKNKGDQPDERALREHSNEDDGPTTGDRLPLLQLPPHVRRETILARWRAQQRAPDDWPDSVTDVGCYSNYEAARVDHLGSFIDAAGGGSLVAWGEPTEFARALWFVAEHEGLYELATHRERVQHFGFGTYQADELEATAHHWMILTDQAEIVPISLAGTAQREAYARGYRDALPRTLRDSAMALYLEPGQPVRVVLWAAQKQSEQQVREYCWNIGGRARDDDEGPRFAPVRYPFQTPYDDDANETPAVYLPARYGTRASGSLRERARRPDEAQADARTLSTWPALDRQLRAGALPMGARGVIAGPPEQCKTTLMLDAAETAAAQGWLVAWVAYDEAEADITARRRQRLPAGVPLNPNLVIVDGVGPYEDLAAEAAADAEAEGRPLMVCVDSLQKLETRAGEGKGERERITAAIDTIQRMQASHPAIVLVTSEVARGSGALKGSGGIDYGGTLVLRPKLAGSKLTVAIAKNRHGGKQPFTLEVDAGRQRIIDLTAPQPEPNLRDRILSAVRGGARSVEAVAKAAAVRAAKARAELKQMVDERVLEHSAADGYRLA
jgi:hypothetical protein